MNKKMHIEEEEEEEEEEEKKKLKTREKLRFRTRPPHQSSKHAQVHQFPRRQYIANTKSPGITIQNFPLEQRLHWKRSPPPPFNHCPPPSPPLSLSLSLSLYTNWALSPFPNIPPPPTPPHKQKMRAFWDAVTQRHA